MGDGGDFNLRDHEDKKWGRRRQEGSFGGFRNFIADMEMGEMKLEDVFTWVNNRENEGFIQERLDRFFGLAEWMIQCDTAEVCHIAREASDHYLLILNSKPQKSRTKSRFIFYSRLANVQGTPQLVKDTWNKPMQMSKIFRVQQKQKQCKIKFREWSKSNKSNARVAIEMIQKEMEAMQVQRGEEIGGKW